MAKSKKISKDHKPVGGKAKMEILSRGLENMTFKDLQRRAVILGMPFPDVAQCDVHKLQSFILKSPNVPNPQLIFEYDKWADNVLETLGYSKDDPLRHYQLRLGFLESNREEEENSDEEKPKRRRRAIKGIKIGKSSIKRVKNSDGILSGTKKSYTYELTKLGYEKNRIIKKVLRKFPDASEKSIKIWIRKCKEQLENQ